MVVLISTSLNSVTIDSSLACWTHLTRNERNQENDISVPNFPSSYDPPFFSTSGSHQYMGNLLCRLFNTSATPSIIPTLKSTSGIINHPSSELGPSTTAISAVAPAGGCTLFVRAMREVARAQARAPPTQRMESAWGERAKSLEMETPVMEAIIWERMALRGWAKGEAMELNSRTAAAPCGVGCVC